MNKILRYSFIALLAMVVGNVMAEDVFVSDFSYATGEKFTGGGDGTFTGSVAATKIQSSNAEDDALKDAYAQFITQWVNGSLTNVYWANQSVKLGTSSKDGSMTSVALGDKMTSNVKVTINVAGWGSGSNSMTLAASTGTVDDATVTLNNGEFSDFTFYITGGDATTALTISGKRMFVKSVKVETVSGTPIHIDEPAFSVAGGVYLEPQTVALTCETEGAKILYTIPAGQDPVYVDDENVTGVWYDDTPLEITRTTTIKAMAVKNGQTSNIVTATYTIVNTTAKGTEADPFTVADAKLVIDALENGVTTAESYYVKGYVVGTPDIQKKADGTFYGNANFDIADTKGGSDKLTCFRLKGLNNENIESEDYIKENDQVLLFGQLQKYVKADVVTPEIVKGYIAKIEAAGPEKNETVVGQEDNSTAWWTAFSDYYTVPAQKTLHLEFENYSYMGENWHNFVVVLANSERGAEGYAEYVAVRADNYGWGACYNENGLESNWNWNNFKAIMNGAKVKLDIIRDGAMAHIKAQVKGSDDNDYFQNYNNINLGDANAKVVAFLTVEKGHLVIDNTATTLDDTTTGITNVTTAKMVNGARYNLAGQRVNAGYKGVVIMNGQKMLVK